MSSSRDRVRNSAVAGQFYPGEPGDLAGLIDALIEEPHPPTAAGEIVGLIVPHAGYAFSGPTAAAAYRALAGAPWRTVVVMAPSHHESFRFASLLDVPYETPLGTVPVDEEFIERLLQLDPVFRISRAGHRSEHAVEVQLPFLQRAVPGASIVPLVLSERSARSIDQIGRALARAIEEQPALMIASSDLYHGYDSDECRHSDERTLEAILRMDPSRFLRALDRGEIQACGAGPIAALLTAAREMGADHAELLASTNSGEVTGNPRGYVVGYAAVALMRGAPEDRVRVSGESTEQALTEEERRTLLALAREALDRAVRCLEPPDPPAPLPAALGARRRCFVTLHRGSQLRGCIGYAEARRPLARAVIDLARAAALEDMRFAPVSIDELGEISIEVSVLTEPVPVSDVAEIEPGRHGVLVSRGLRRALLLPQVAEEQGWDARRLLEHCCLKAGLPAESWSDAETEIQRFEAEVFGAGAPSRSGYEGGTGGAGASR